MRLVNQLTAFAWTEPLDVLGVPMRGTPEKQGTSFSRTGWLTARTSGTDADIVGRVYRERQRPRSAGTLALARGDYAAGNVPRYPSYFIVEPTAFCNKSCPFCPLSVGVARPNRYGRQQTTMAFDDFATLVEELRRERAAPYGISLYGLGESLLWREGGSTIGDFVSEAKTVFTVANLSTNGDVANLDDLIGSDLDDLIISVDGTTEATYLANRPSTKANDVGAFGRTVARIRAFLDRKASSGLQRPYVRLQIINKANTAPEIVDFIRTWIAVPGVDDVFVKHLDAMTPWVGDAAVSREESAAKLAAVASMPCQHLYAVGWMNAAGQFGACCHDSRAELTAGAFVGETSFADWWHGPFMRALREEHRGGASRLPCRLCVERDPWLG